MKARASKVPLDATSLKALSQHERYVLAFVGHIFNEFVWLQKMLHCSPGLFLRVGLALERCSEAQIKRTMAQFWSAVECEILERVEERYRILTGEAAPRVLRCQR